ncbi:hypothetical protein DTO027B5_3467 [Paecilomyces variotii]|nr:hypothetical protein DTO032I3_5394 [Paecilomyces variotii]KAJ9227405.1 hypothetical protein DTO169C6_46 [Paecilomyces variotii]KAJ9276706.1 hypothetical protein DTO021D3_6466 [Paecilomyces variotii]KAJ9321524.1 hypothetical protein DTO027B3_7424 [Paecilomyces variotii]KAJ9334670.1 hypothetical protein DTO027B5_3467 [Paecilomyces variotii]
MSAQTTTYSHEKNEDIPRFTTKGPHNTEPDSVDKRLKDLRDKVLPVYPFLLTVPSDVPFRLGDRYVNNWAVGTDGPFKPEEQQLQYMTFLTHSEGDSLLVAVGDWSDDSGNIMAEDDSKPTSVTSAASTPLTGATKKKISLSDYKSKKITSGQTTSGNQGAIDGAAPAPDTPKNHARISKQATNDSSVPQTDSPKRSKPHIHTEDGAPRRKRSVEPESKPSKEEDRRHGGRSPKKPRLSPLKTESGDGSQTNGATHALPALLSPTLPPVPVSPKLPQLLSPTLPPDIEEELSKLRDESPITNIHAKDRSPIPPRTSKHDPDGRRPHSGSLASSKNPNINNKAVHTHNRSTSGSKTVAHDPRESSGSTGRKMPSSTHGTDSPSSKTRLIVKLKYGRSNRKRVEALLKFSGKRKAAGDSARSNLAEDHDSRDNRTKKDLSLSKLQGDRRQRLVESDDYQDMPRKRPKTVAPGSASPSSPVPASDATGHHSRSFKSVTSAPKRDARGTSSRHPDPEDTEARSQLAGKTTPLHPERSTRASPPLSRESKPTHSRDRERRAWRDEYQKYAGLGRELKHAASRQTTDAKLAAATAVEAILCFILAFIADDRCKTITRQVPDSTNWRSILAYWRVVTKNSVAYPHLHSLCLLLGAISHDTIHALDLERLAVSPLPGEHSPVPTPGSDGHTVTADESKKYKSEFLELKARLPEYYKEALRLWLEGARKLSDETLKHEFPSTWSKRSGDYLDRGKEPLKLGSYSGRFFLPLGRTTTPLEAVRFGFSVLTEWCQKEGVDWHGRLQL